MAAATAQNWALLGDLHTGSKTGLTSAPSTLITAKLKENFDDAVAWLGPDIDVALINGDITDGVDIKGNDVLTTDLLDQAEDAAELIMQINPKREVILMSGTRYHDSVQGQQFLKHVKSEIQIRSLERTGKKLRVSMSRKLKTTINGWFVLEARHTIGASKIPHGRATAALRFQMWNVLNAALQAMVRGGKISWPNLLVFSHAHYYLAAENAWGDVVVLPSWQANGGVFGDEQCEGHTDLGVVKLTVGAKETDGWARDKKLYLAGVVPRTEHR